MLFDRRRPREEPGADGNDTACVAFPSRSSSLSPFMTSQKKPQPASRPYTQVYQNKVANQDTIESGLRKHPFYTRDVSSPSRYSLTYIGPEPANASLTVQPQSRNPKMPEPENLAIRSHKPELQLRSSASSTPHKSTTPAVRRRRPELALQNSTISTPYRATPSVFGKSPVNHYHVRATDIPELKSICKQPVVGASSTSSLAYPPSLQTVAVDSQERRSSSANPGFVKLGPAPLSSLHLDFVDQGRPSIPPSCDPGFSPRSTFERPASAAGDSRPALSCIPTYRRSSTQTPGLATRTPPRYQLPGARNNFRSSTSLASVLASAASTSTEADKGVASDGKRRIQRHLSLPDLRTEAELGQCGTQQPGGLKLETLRNANVSPLPGYKRNSNGGKQTQSTTMKSKNGIGSPSTGSQLGSQGVSTLSGTTSSSTNVTNNGAQDILKDELSVPLSSQHHRCFSVGDTPGTPSSRKRLSILRELIEEPLDDFDFVRQVSSSHSQATREELCNQHQSQIASTQDYAALKSFADEILDTSDDSSVKRVSESSEDKPANQADPYDISRPDSGFISATSSLTSPGSPWQTDSGYSSTASIRSKSAVAISGIAEKATIGGLLGRDTKNPSDDKARTVGHEDDSTNEASRDSFISLSRSSVRLLSSLIRPRHSLLVSGTDGDGSQLNPNGSNSIKGPSQPRDSTVSQGGAVKPRARSNSGSQLAGKLQRLFAHHKEDELSTGFASHDPQTVPTVPVEVKQRLSEHNRVFPTSPKKLTKHSNRSTESLKTIISVDSALAYSESNYSQDSHHDEISKRENSIQSGTTYKGHKNMNSLDSSKSLSSLASSGTARSLSSSESATSDSTIAAANDTKIFHIEALLEGCELEEAEDGHGTLQSTTSPATIPAVLPAKEAIQDVFIGEKPVPPPRNPSRHSRQMSNHKSMLRTSQDVTEKAAPNETSATWRAQDSRFIRNERAIPGSQTRRTHIGSGLEAYMTRAPASAPDLLNSLSFKSEAATRSGTRLTAADLAKELPPEPPRDNMLRSSFSKRPWRQRRLAERNWLQTINHESVQSHETHYYQVQSQTTTVMGQEQTRVAQDHISVYMSRRRHSTLIHRPAFSEALAVAPPERPKNVPRPPYRVLHSYNSPAYKNIPIWA